MPFLEECNMNFNEFLVKLGEQIEGIKLVTKKYGQVITNGKVEFEIDKFDDSKGLWLGAFKYKGDCRGFRSIYKNFDEYIKQLKLFFPKDIKWRKEHYVQLNLWEASNS